MKVIYLAGGMSDDWQDKASSLLPGCICKDPRSWSDPTPAIYTKRDIDALLDSSYMLAYMDSRNPSGFGLSLELGYAAALGRKIVFVDAIKDDWRSKYFGMHRELASYVAPNIATACAWILVN